jgi:hypothetical protein
MKIRVVAFALLFASYAYGTEKTYDDLIHAIHMVEASGRMNPPDGDQGQAIGPFQIHRAYWQDAVVYDKSLGGTYQDCRNYQYARKIVDAYFRRYGMNYIEQRDWKALARIHNGGGPNGATNPNTLVYWEKVKKHLYKE